MKDLELFVKKFKRDELKISENDYWVWSLRPAQVTIGSSILSLKRYAASFSELSTKEGQGLVEIVKKIETKTKNAFSYDKINYLMLMMVDKHLHFHIIPRYSFSIQFEDTEWEDNSWPNPPNLKVNNSDDYLLFKIRDFLILA